MLMLTQALIIPDSLLPVKYMCSHYICIFFNIYSSIRVFEHFKKKKIKNDSKSLDHKKKCSYLSFFAKVQTFVLVKIWLT